MEAPSYDDDGRRQRVRARRGQDIRVGEDGEAGLPDTGRVLPAMWKGKNSVKTVVPSTQTTRSKNCSFLDKASALGSLVLKIDYCTVFIFFSLY